MSERVDHLSPVTKQEPETLVLRGRPRPVVRFRRGLIIGLVGAVSVSLIVISWLALEPKTLVKVAQASGSDEPSRSAAPAALANVPKSYSDVPQLGPPLPGDLGRPIVEHQRSLDRRFPQHRNVGDFGSNDRVPDDERVRLEASTAAARSSPVLVQLAAGNAQPQAIPAALEQSAALNSAGGATAPSESVAGAQQKVEFARTGKGDRNPGTLQQPLSRFTLTAGTIIPASLITGINSDVPGMVIAQVTESVRDSATGTMILIPQGARLIGRYDSVVAYGQRRALVVWDRILFPDASSVDLDNVPAADLSGYSGLKDGVNSHTWQLLKGVGLSTLLGVGSELSFQNSGSDLVRAIRESAQQSAANAGGQITSRGLDVQPTIKVRPGWPVRAILNKDIVLQPWKG